MQRQTGAGAAGKRESSERGNAEKIVQHSEALGWPGSASSKSTALEQSPEQVKLFHDFREHFEAFYQGEPLRKKTSGGFSGSERELHGGGPLFAPSSSGVDSAYAYNSDDEYVDNLRLSGNFSAGAVADYKEGGGQTRAAHFQLANGPVPGAGARQEIEYYKSFDNVFDLVEDQAAPGEEQPGGKSDLAHFYQYSFENMHKRSSQGALLRQGKKKSPAIAAVNTQKKAVVKPQGVRSPAKVNPAAQKQTTTAAKRGNQGSGRK